MAALCNAAAVGTAAAATGVSPMKSMGLNLSSEMPLHGRAAPRSLVAHHQSRSMGFPRLKLNYSATNKMRMKATTKLVEHRSSVEKVVGLSKNLAVAEQPLETDNGAGQSQRFLDVKTEEDLFMGMRKEIEAKQLPASAAAAMEEVYRNYHDAVLNSGVPNAKEIVLSNMAATFDRILLQYEDPFTFPSYHKAIRDPFDYYTFGQNYIRPLIDFRNSYVGNLAYFGEMDKQLKQGNNIILFSNHQSEADPAAIALMLETSNPDIAEKITYVAGDRVVLDPICKPFSMGRNLLCVYSKKHIDDVPELAEMKKKANARTLKEMALLLRKGGQVIWIAPSGGRDRPNPDTKEWIPASFDVAAVDNMRRLVEHSGVPGHMYPLALLCYDIMPPPPQVEREIGEKRKIGFHGVGISVGPEINFNEFVATLENQEEVKSVFSKTLYDTVVAHYNVLKSAIYGGKGTDASNSIVSLSQPWKRSSSTSNGENL